MFTINEKVNCVLRGKSFTGKIKEMNERAYFIVPTPGEFWKYAECEGDCVTIFRSASKNYNSNDKIAKIK